MEKMKLRKLKRAGRKILSIFLVVVCIPPSVMQISAGDPQQASVDFITNRIVQYQGNPITEALIIPEDALLSVQYDFILDPAHTEQIQVGDYAIQLPEHLKQDANANTNIEVMGTTADGRTVTIGTLYLGNPGSAQAIFTISQMNKQAIDAIVSPVPEETTTIEEATTTVTEEATTTVTEEATTIVTEEPTTTVTEEATTIVTEEPTTTVTKISTTDIQIEHVSVPLEKHQAEAPAVSEPIQIIPAIPTAIPTAIQGSFAITASVDWSQAITQIGVLQTVQQISILSNQANGTMTQVKRVIGNGVAAPKTTPPITLEFNQFLHTDAQGKTGIYKDTGEAIATIIANPDNKLDDKTTGINSGDSFYTYYEFGITEEQLQQIDTDTADTASDHKFVLGTKDYPVGMIWNATGSAITRDITIQRSESTSSKLGTLHLEVTSAGKQSAYVVFEPNLATTFGGDITGGYVYFKSTLDTNQITEDGSLKIQWSANGSATITVEDKVPKAPTLEKKCNGYDADTGHFKWSIHYTHGKLDPTQVPTQIMDTFDSTRQELVTGSVTWGTAANPTTVLPSASSGVIGYTEIKGTTGHLNTTISFPLQSTYDTQDTYITYETALTDAVINTNNTSTPTDITVENTIALQDKDGTEIKVDGAKTATGTAPKAELTWITKSGAEVSLRDRYLNWTITVKTMDRALADLTLTDTLPDGLTLDTSTLKITDGKNPGTTFRAGTDYTLTTQASDPEITITFIKTKDSNTAYHPTYVVTYQTKVADQYYEDPSTLPTKGFQNSAKLTFTWNDYAGGTATVTHTPPSIGTEVAPNVKLIEKNGLTYDTKTGIIRWQITLNPHKVDVRSATITDVFDQRTDYSLAYIQGSLKCDGNTSDATTHKVSWTEPTGITSLPEITVGEIGKETHVITFETQVLNKAHTGGNGSTTYDNTANITAQIMPAGGTIEATRSDATTAKQEVKSQVLAKKGMGYDYDTHELTWEVTINQNQMAMSGVTVTDQLSQYQFYVDGSAKKISGPNTCTITANTTGDATTTKGQTLTLGTWDFAKGDKPLVIQFKTKLDVDQIPAFKDTKGDISFTNQATLHRSDLGYQDVTSNQATIKVVNHPLTKTAASLQDGSIPYTIQINPLGLNLLHTPALTDTLPEGLQLDRDTVILTKAVRQKDGTLQASTNPADQQKWASGCFTYDVKNRVFTIRLAANTSDSYILTYSADIVDSTKSPFQNSVVLSGSSYDDSISGSINSVTVSGGGGGGIVSKRGTITIKKVDKDDTSIALAGAVFRITQQSSGYVITEVTTDQQGQAVVKGLKPNQTYLIQEIQAPKGYPLPNPCPQQTWTPAKAGDQISVTWVNDKQYQPPKPTTPPDTGSTNPSQPGHQTPPVTPPVPTKPMAPIPGTPEFARVYHQVLGESMPARAWSAQVKAEQARKIQAEVLADTALPQTGQNKLLPILLLVCGILFMITGYYGYHKNRRRKHDKNE